MKRFLSLLLAAAFVFSLAACSNNKSTVAKRDTDVERYAKNGRISDIDCALGDSIDDAKAVLSATLDDHGEPMYFEYPSGEYTVMTDGEACCCYKTANAASGITHIVKYGDAYGFKGGDVSTQVRDTMAKKGYDARERNAKTGELFFLPGGDTLTVLEYKIKNHTVLFAFQENALSATVIY